RGRQREVLRRGLGKPAGVVRASVRVHLLRQLVGIRQVDLIETLISLRPKGIAPGVIERCDRCVSLLQPRSKRVTAGVRIAVLGAVVRELVVNLPTPDVWVTAEPL